MSEKILLTQTAIIKYLIGLENEVEEIINEGKKELVTYDQYLYEAIFVINQNKLDEQCFRLSNLSRLLGRVRVESFELKNFERRKSIDEETLLKLTKTIWSSIEKIKELSPEDEQIAIVKKKRAMSHNDAMKQFEKLVEENRLKKLEEQENTKEVETKEKEQNKEEVLEEKESIEVEEIRNEEPITKVEKRNKNFIAKFRRLKEEVHNNVLKVKDKVITKGKEKFTSKNDRKEEQGLALEPKFSEEDIEKELNC